MPADADASGAYVGAAATLYWGDRERSAAKGMGEPIKQVAASSPASCVSFEHGLVMQAAIRNKGRRCMTEDTARQRGLKSSHHAGLGRLTKQDKPSGSPLTTGLYQRPQIQEFSGCYPRRSRLY